MTGGLEGGDTHMLRPLYEDVPPKLGLLFHQISPGPILIKKSEEGVPFSQKLRKKLKSAIFEVKNPYIVLEMGPDLRKFQKKKKKKTRKISRF